jgi:hypothetical protein
MILKKALLLMNHQNNYLADKIRNYADLPNGWHYGDGMAPSAATIETAIRIGEESLKAGFEFVDALPGIEGEIQILAYLGSFRAEATIDGDGRIDLILEDDDNLIYYSEKIGSLETISRLQFWGNLWPFISTLFTQNTIFLGKKDSPALHLNRLPKIPESLSLTKDVLKENKIDQFAGTSSTFIQPLRENQPFFGNSSPKSSHRGVASYTTKANPEMTAMPTSMD